jgi:hypothetical protein
VSDKIRIVGAFGEGAVGKVQEFVKGLDGVQSVSVLHDGVETYPDADSLQAEQDTTGGEATPATPTQPEQAPDYATPA